MNNIKTSAVITSGGTSSRFGSNKLLEKIGELSVIETTISKFTDTVDEIVIPCGDKVRKHIENSKLFCEKIKFAPFGNTRQKSVYFGLLKCSNPKIVLIHDGARPFIKKEEIEKIIEMTNKKGAAVAGCFAIDTIKEVKNGKIIKTLDRKTIFQAHTPQAFSYDLIRKIHEKYKNYDTYTDDSSMAEIEGVEVSIFEDSKENIKITFREDLYNHKG